MRRATGASGVMPVTQDQIAKLPRWAREHIEILEQTKDTLTRELRQFQGAEDSPITMRRLLSLVHVPLPEAAIRFHFAHSWVDIRVGETTLDINGSEQIHISPRGANHAILRCRHD